MKPVLHQLEIQNQKEGMSYIIQDCAGKIIIIDGALGGDALYLLDYLKQITGLEKPVVDTWFLSHVHPDHIFCLKEIGEKYSDQISVKKIVYNFPPAELLAKLQSATVKEVEKFENAIKSFDAQIITTKRGDVFPFDGLEFKTLFTWEDMGEYFEKKYNTNDTSTVIRLSVEGQKILFLGDASEAADKYMIELLGEAELKSDVVQMAHHGGFGSTAEFYSIVDPQFLLWPLGCEKFEVFYSMVKVNKLLVESPKIKEIFLSGNGTRAIPLPIKESAQPFKPIFSETKEADEKNQAEISFAKIAPDIKNFDDPAWLQAEEKSFVVTKQPHYGGVASYRLLWDENNLYLKVSFSEGSPIYDPLKHSSLDSSCLGVFFSEKPIRDTYLEWKELKEGIVLNNLKLYPDWKIIDEKKVNMLLRGVDNEKLSTLCTQHSVASEDGFTVCAQIGFSEPKKAGDVLNLELQLAIVEEENAKKSGYYSILSGVRAKYLVFRPAFMNRFVLK